MNTLDKLQKKICKATGSTLTAILSNSLNSLLKQRQSKVYFIGITLEDVHLNWLNWFFFLILTGCLLIVLICCIFQSQHDMDV